MPKDGEDYPVYYPLEKTYDMDECQAPYRNSSDWDYPEYAIDYRYTNIAEISTLPTQYEM